MPLSWRLMTMEPTPDCHSSTQKPVMIIEILIVSAVGVLDPFAGSGTTGVTLRQLVEERLPPAPYLRRQRKTRDGRIMFADLA